jgi:hypothetical protein
MSEVSNTPSVPYYQDDLVTIYHGDCLDLLDVYSRFPPGAHTESLPSDPFGDVRLLVTDPPYGIALDTSSRWDFRPSYSARIITPPGYLMLEAGSVGTRRRGTDSI